MLKWWDVLFYLGNIVAEKHQIVMYYNSNLILYNNNTIRLAYSFINTIFNNNSK